MIIVTVVRVYFDGLNMEIRSALLETKILILRILNPYHVLLKIYFPSSIHINTDLHGLIFFHFQISSTVFCKFRNDGCEIITKYEHIIKHESKCQYNPFNPLKRFV